ncbi:hypothetical protein B0H10DRAFT_1952592 [Mycena sp. CBHHK59/15]|nr:hypothetical protein B0H10DRAFT_1952592 [Mycena sp. CBHHK59/15]
MCVISKVAAGGEWRRRQRAGRRRREQGGGGGGGAASRAGEMRVIRPVTHGRAARDTEMAGCWPNDGPSECGRRHTATPGNGRKAENLDRSGTSISPRNIAAQPDWADDATERLKMNHLPRDTQARIVSWSARGTQVALLRTCRQMQAVATDVLYTTIAVEDIPLPRLPGRIWMDWVPATAMLLRTLERSDALANKVSGMTRVDTMRLNTPTSKVQSLEVGHMGEPWEEEAQAAMNQVVPTLTCLRSLRVLSHWQFRMTRNWGRLDHLTTVDWRPLANDAVWMFLVENWQLTDLRLELVPARMTLERGFTLSDWLPNVHRLHVSEQDAARLLHRGRVTDMEIGGRGWPGWPAEVPEGIRALERIHGGDVEELIVWNFEDRERWDWELVERDTGVGAETERILRHTRALPALRRLAFKGNTTRASRGPEQAKYGRCLLSIVERSELEVFHFCGESVCTTHRSGESERRWTREASVLNWGIAIEFLSKTTSRHSRMLGFPTELRYAVARASGRKEQLAHMKTCRQMRDVAERFLYADISVGQRNSGATVQGLMDTLDRNGHLQAEVQTWGGVKRLEIVGIDNDEDVEALEQRMSDVIPKLRELQVLKVAGSLKMTANWGAFEHLTWVEWRCRREDTLFRFLLSNRQITVLKLGGRFDQAYNGTPALWLPRLRTIDVSPADLGIFVCGRPVERIALRESEPYELHMTPHMWLALAHADTVRALQTLDVTFLTLIDNVPTWREQLEEVIVGNFEIADKASKSWELGERGVLGRAAEQIMGEASRMPSLRRLAFKVDPDSVSSSGAQYRQASAMYAWAAWECTQPLDVFHYCGTTICVTVKNGAWTQMESMPTELKALVAKESDKGDQLALMKTCASMHDVVCDLLYVDINVTGAGKVRRLCISVAAPTGSGALEDAMNSVVPKLRDLERLGVQGTHWMSMTRPWGFLPQLRAIEWRGLVGSHLFDFLCDHTEIRELMLGSGGFAAMGHGPLPKLRKIHKLCMAPEDAALFLVGQPTIVELELLRGTIPASFADWSGRDIRILRATAVQVRQLMGEARRFMDQLEELVCWDFDVMSSLTLDEPLTSDQEEDRGLNPLTRDMMIESRNMVNLRLLAFKGDLMFALGKQQQRRYGLQLAHFTLHDRPKPLKTVHFCGLRVCVTIRDGDVHHARVANNDAGLLEAPASKHCFK